MIIPSFESKIYFGKICYSFIYRVLTLEVYCMLRHLFISFFAISIFLFTSTVFAKMINLYDQPKSDAKVVGTIDPSTGIIPIYTPKDSTWVKVGNPTNGNVGWVKATDLAQASTTSNGFSFSQQIENTGTGPEKYVFKLGIPTKLTKEQSDALYQEVQKQQAIIQQGVQKLIQDMFSNYNQQMNTLPTSPANPKK